MKLMRTVGRVLALIHKKPEQPWSLASLASEAAMSASGLRGRFGAVVGESPIRYLHRWRLALARLTTPKMAPTPKTC